MAKAYLKDKEADDKLNYSISPKTKNFEVDTESLLIKDDFFGESEVFIENIIFNVPNLKKGILSLKLSCFLFHN